MYVLLFEFAKRLTAPYLNRWFWQLHKIQILSVEMVTTLWAGLETVETVTARIWRQQRYAATRISALKLSLANQIPTLRLDNEDRLIKRVHTQRIEWYNWDWSTWPKTQLCIQHNYSTHLAQNDAHFLFWHKCNIHTTVYSTKQHIHTTTTTGRLPSE